MSSSETKSLPTVDLKLVQTEVLSTRDVKNAENNETSYTLYVICVKIEGKDIAWTVERRFSDFESLHSSLSSFSSLLPELPAKTWFRSFLSSFIEKRRADLDVYLKKLLRIPYCRHSIEMIRFLEITSHVTPDVRNVS